MDIKKGLDAGASVYLKKTVADLELKESIENAILADEQQGIGI